MNINSPVFIPLQLTTQQQQQPTVAVTTTNDKSPLMGSSTAIAKTPNFGPWQQQQQLLLQSNISNYNYYQQQRQQQFFYHQQQQQRHFYNPNLQYGQWSNMAQQQQKKILQQQQQQQQQQKSSNNKKLQQQHHHHHHHHQQQQQRNKIVKPSKMLTSSTTATKLKVLVTLPPAELKLEAVAAAASTSTTTEIEKTIATMKDDTMQRNGSKASQHSTKSHHQHHHHHHQQHSPSKHDSSDSGLSSHGLAVSAQINSNKSRKSARSSSKRSDCNRSKIAGTSASSSTMAAASAVGEETTTFSVNAWLGRDMAYCYERRFIASCAEDNMIPRHNTTHRNSTSSDMAASDELNSSSSNEDLSTAYLVNAKSNKKTKSRQKRQQKRSKQQSNQTHTHDVITTTIPMDIDEELKENRRPPNNQQHTGQATKHNAATAANLRKQCTKAAALKLVAGVTNKVNVSAAMKASGNALATSTSGSSVCSSLSASSSATSIPSSVSSSAASTPNQSPTASPTISKRNAGSFKKIARALAPPLRQHTKLQLTEQQLVSQLRRYIIDPNLLRVYGFPVESAIHEGCVEIYKCLPKPFTTHHHHHPNAGGSTLSGSSAQNRQSVQHATSNVINTNDGLYVPHFNNDAQQLSSADSGQGSGVSSPPSVDSDSSEVGEDEPATTTAFYTPDGSYQIFSQYDQSLEKQCVRCNGTFHVTETGEYLTQEECRFHWGKLNHMYTSSKGFAYQYSCCEGDQSEVGCSSNRLHVWTGAVVGINGPYTDFVHTKRRLGGGGGGGVSHYHYERGTTTRSTKVYALDCEMSFTGLGLEVTKITVVGHDGQMVYEHFVRPEAEIVDYNTRFSGITANDLCASSTNSVKTLSQVQRDLLQLFDADTILIGHGLDNDLRVLRIVHKTIIDTSIAFPHASGFPYRRALKHLTKVCLNRDIQCSEAGHSSFEDSRACLELMLWKVRKEMRHDDWAAATAMAGQ